MYVVISYIKLKTIFHFFKLSHYALFVNLQIKKSACVKFKKQGFWKDHYTITMWKNKDDMYAFSKQGAHLKAMQIGHQIASEIKTVIIETDEFPTWSEAKSLIQTG